MTGKTAAARVTPVRQRTQFTCMSASMAIGLRALDVECSEDEVNRVMGCAPMQGATWEDALASAQHYGVRGTLVVPSTVEQLKRWTDAGTPVLIAWNPEGREWSHASLVFDVTGPEGAETIHVADPNIPDPSETVREVSREEFYRKWYEKWPRYLVRRPAMALEREITPGGRPVMAGKKERRSLRDRMRSIRLKQSPTGPAEDTMPTLSPEAWRARVEQGLGGLPGAGRGGPHQDSNDYRRRPKHPGREVEGSSPLQLQPDHGTPMKLLSATEFLRALDEKDAKFEKDKPMTPEAVSEVVGPEFKENVDNPPPDVQKLKEELQGKSASFTLTAREFLTALESSSESKEAKFERGVSMTIDEVAEVVGDEFKEMNVNPPDSVVKVREEMTGKTAAGRATHMEDPKKKGFNLCGEKVYPDTARDTIGEVTCYYCKSEWQRRGSKTASAVNVSCYNCGRDERVPGLSRAVNDYVMALPEGWGAVKAPNGDRLEELYCGRCLSPDEGSRMANCKTAGMKRTLKCYWCGTHAAVDFFPDVINSVGLALELPAGWGSEIGPNNDTLGIVRCAKCVRVGVREAGTERTAAGGLYGYTRDIEGACTGACRRVGKSAVRLAKALYAKDSLSPSFLQAHAKRGGSKTARLLLKAMEEIGPLAQLTAKTAASSGIGLYGFKEKTARLALQACVDLHHEAGLIAGELNSRRAAQHDRITGFLQSHARTARCAYSALLLEAYPEAAKTASDFLAGEEDSPETPSSEDSDD